MPKAALLISNSLKTQVCPTPQPTTIRRRYLFFSTISFGVGVGAARSFLLSPFRETWGFGKRTHIF